MPTDLKNAQGPMLSVRLRAGQMQETLLLPIHRSVTLGRDQACDLVLPSPSVSRQHLVVSAQGGRLLIRDQSSLGSRVNGKRVHASCIEVDGQAELELGPYALRFDLRDGTSRTFSGVQDVELQEDGVESSLVSADTRRRMRGQLLECLDLLALDRTKMSAEAMRPTVRDALSRIAHSLRNELPNGHALDALLDELCHEVLGLGPLEPLLADPSVSEIMVVDPHTIYVERDGRVELAPTTFTDETAARAVIERIVTPLGRRIDESNPIVDARLKDGSRVNAIIPPLALKGPSITIRKFPQQRLTLGALIERGSLSPEMGQFLAHCVAVKINMVIAGGTGSGKTTLLNVLSAAIPQHERIVTIEDAAELQLVQRHVVSLEARPPNMEGQGAVSIRELVKNALRMRPDRIVVGECRGGEALDMLQAMNTGHDGSMTTTHANSPKEAVQRLETLCLMAGLDLPLSAIRRQIAGSVNLLVQQARFADGARRITHITEVVGLRDDGEVELRQLFAFASQASASGGEPSGIFSATGAIPSFADRFVAHGLFCHGGAQ